MKIKYGVYGLLDSHFVVCTNTELPTVVGFAPLMSEHATMTEAKRAAGLETGPEFPLCDCGANVACAGGLYGPPPHKEGCAAFPRVGGTFTLGGETGSAP